MFPNTPNSRFVKIRKKVGRSSGWRKRLSNMILGGLIHSDGLANITQQVVMESWRIPTFGPSDYLIYINLASKKNSD